MRFAKKINSLNVSEIRRAFDRKNNLKNSIDLSIGQPHFPTPPAIIAAYKKALSDGETSYSQTMGVIALREKIAEVYHSHPEQVIVSAGIAPLLWMLFSALIEPNDQVLTSEPTFLIYKSLIPFFLGKQITLPETFHPEQLKDIKNPKKIKMILLANPSNPSGYIYSQLQIQALVKFAKTHDILLVVDEIYRDFDYDRKLHSLQHYLNEKDLAAILLSGFSKSYSMTGLRLGMAIGHKKTIDQLGKLQQYSIVCAPTPCQISGITALTVDISSRIEYYNKNRALCLKALKALKNKFTFTFPSGAFYIFLRMIIPKINDKEIVLKAREQEKLLIVPGRIFCSSKKFIRLSYAVDRSNLKKGLVALSRIFTI